MRKDIEKKRYVAKWNRESELNITESEEGWDAKTQFSIFREGKPCYCIKETLPTQYNLSNFWHKYLFVRTLQPGHTHIKSIFPFF